jgi:hypothetical protein
MHKAGQHMFEAIQDSEFQRFIQDAKNMSELKVSSAHGPVPLKDIAETSSSYIRNKKERLDKTETLIKGYLLFAKELKEYIAQKRVWEKGVTVKFTTANLRK